MAHLNASIQEQICSPLTEAQCAAILQQLYSLLQHPLFCHSKRYPAFLRYVVERTLSGHAAELKERSIGLDVFQRDLLYDTNADPIVRVTAAEIRKRLAQYYFEEGHEREIRIELASGSYVPVFHMPEELSLIHGGRLKTDAGDPHARAEAAAEQLDSAVPASNAGLESQAQARSGWAPVLRLAARHLISRRLVGALVLTSFLLAGAAVIGAKRTPHSPEFNQFWDQIAKADGPVQICFGAAPGMLADRPGLPVTLKAFEVARRVTDVLDQRKKTYMSMARLLGPEPTDLSQLRDGPIIFWGPWEPVQPIMQGWRYRFAYDDATSTVWVVEGPSSNKLWRTAIARQELSQTYAILARVLDRQLHRPVVIVAGTERRGIGAAMDVLTTPAFMEMLLKDAPADWENMNLEAVIEAHVVNGEIESPRVVAKQFWK